MRLQPGEEDQHRERHPAPDARDDDRPHRVGAQQPDRPVAEQVRVVDEDLVDDPDVALPHEAARGPRRRSSARSTARSISVRTTRCPRIWRLSSSATASPPTERPADGPERVHRRCCDRAEEARVQRVVGCRRGSSGSSRGRSTARRRAAWNVKVLSFLKERTSPPMAGSTWMSTMNDQRRRDQRVGAAGWAARAAGLGGRGGGFAVVTSARTSGWRVGVLMVQGRSPGGAGRSPRPPDGRRVVVGASPPWARRASASLAAASSCDLTVALAEGLALRPQRGRGCCRSGPCRRSRSAPTARSARRCARP